MTRALALLVAWLVAAVAAVQPHAATDGVERVASVLRDQALAALTGVDGEVAVAVLVALPEGAPDAEGLGHRPGAPLLEALRTGGRFRTVQPLRASQADDDVLARRAALRGFDALVVVRAATRGHYLEATVRAYRAAHQGGFVDLFRADPRPAGDFALRTRLDAHLRRYVGALPRVTDQNLVARAMPLPRHGYLALAPNDLDGDGRTELVLVRAGGDVVVPPTRSPCASDAYPLEDACAQPVTGRDGWKDELAPRGDRPAPPPTPSHFHARAARSLAVPDGSARMVEAIVTPRGRLAVRVDDRRSGAVGYGAALGMADQEDDGLAELLVSSPAPPGTGGALSLLRVRGDGVITTVWTSEALEGSVLLAGAAEFDDDGREERIAVEEPPAESGLPARLWVVPLVGERHPLLDRPARAAGGGADPPRTPNPRKERPARAAVGGAMRTGLGAGAGSTALVLAAVVPVRGALPPMFGGEARLPAPGPVATLDPAEASTPFEASVAAALCDGLYRVDRDGSVVPVLAEGMPEIEGLVATVRLRRGVRRHVGSEVHAVSVASTLRRAARHPRAAWLLAALGTEGREPDVQVAAEDAIRTGLAREGVDLARVLAAGPLALATGADPRRRPPGTGPFAARLGRGGVHLRAFRFAAQGAPYLDGVRILAPRPREESLRAFELGRLDGSWHGESLYGGRPVRAVTSTCGPAVAPVRLVPNRARGALRNGALWSAIAGNLDRQRLERVGLEPSTTLGPGLPPPRTGRARPPASRQSLLLIVRDDDAFEQAPGEALAGVLDELNVAVRIDALPAGRYEAAEAGGRWDLRIETVTPPLPGPTPLVGAAFAAAGQVDRARPLALALADPRAGARAAPQLRAAVPGHRAPVLAHPVALRNVRFDALGRLDFGALAFARAVSRRAVVGRGLGGRLDLGALAFAREPEP